MVDELAEPRNFKDELVEGHHRNENEGWKIDSESNVLQVFAGPMNDREGV